MPRPLPLPFAVAAAAQHRPPALPPFDALRGSAPAVRAWLRAELGLAPSAGSAGSAAEMAAIEAALSALLEGTTAEAWARASAAELGALHERALGPELRRARGAHYTASAVTEALVERALGPLLARCEGGNDVLALRVCDPAMGAGAFLIAAGKRLASALREHWAREARASASASDELARASPTAPEQRARALVARHCLFGVDVDADAVELARQALWLFAGPRERLCDFMTQNLVCADALGLGPGDFSTWFPDVFARAPANAGFDAVVGNPPWVSYAGRAAQPLAPEVRRHYAGSPAFAGYKNLQGLFVHRAATLLRPGGRLGFVLPTSMSDLAGYAPSRRAHDALCACDDALPDFAGGGFDGVFQPCMGLLSTRRAPGDAPARDLGHGHGLDAPWPLARPDLDAPSDKLRAKLARLPRLPPELFGERGYQSNRGEAADFAGAPTARHTAALRVGGDVRAFERRAPSVFADPSKLGARLRSEAEWRRVDVLLRQTARVPVAARSDGLAFRNSLLAAFGSARYPADFLVAYLNASPVRFAHWVTHRDARQGMPQLKIGHLRDLPAPLERASDAIATLEQLGAELSHRNGGLDEDDQARLDAAACDALGLTADERALVRAWASSLTEAGAKPSPRSFAGEPRERERGAPRPRG